MYLFNYRWMVLLSTRDDGVIIVVKMLRRDGMSNFFFIL